MGNSRICYTIHNFKHQGVCGGDILQATGLRRPEYYGHYDRLRDNFNPGALNLMKGGIVYSNAVTTVSPQYSWEVRYTDQGFGLGHTLKIHEHKFSGVLNGVDYDVWNPEVDRHIPVRYGAGNLEDKYRNKEALRDRLWLRKGYKPLISFVGRLDPQKGINLIAHALDFALANGSQFVLLGSSPDAGISSAFAEVKRRMNDHPDCHLELRHDEELSHLIYAGVGHPDRPQRIRAMWPDADDRTEVRNSARGARRGGPDEHGFRPRLLREAEAGTQRLRISPVRRPRRSNPRCSALSGCGTRIRRNFRSWCGTA